MKTGDGEALSSRLSISPNKDIRALKNGQYSIHHSFIFSKGGVSRYMKFT